MKHLKLPLMALAFFLATPQIYAQLYTSAEPLCRYDIAGRLVKVENQASSAAFEYRAATLDGQDYDAVLNISDPSMEIRCFLVVDTNGQVKTSRVIETAADEFTELYTATFHYDTDGRLVEIAKDGFLGHKTTSIDASSASYTTALAAEGVEMPYLQRAGLFDKTNARANLATTLSQSTVYDIYGTPHHNPVKGIYIIRRSDGTYTKSMHR